MKIQMMRMVSLSTAVAIFLFFSAGTLPAEETARVGVLAYRGSDSLEQKWSGLQKYLNASVPGWTFEIVPVTLRSAKTIIDNGELDFLVTNPGHFVDLKKDYPLSVLASRRQLKSDGSYASEFGSAIITRADSGITHLQDVVGKKVAAVDPRAFGGFQTAWRAFGSVGVDLFNQKTELVFVGFPMDQIVLAVIEGRVDVGIIRSGMLEEFIAKEVIEASDLIVLNANVNYTHPDKTSTTLYPEWPFVSFNTTDAKLRDSVALSLMRSQEDAASNGSGMINRWTAPLSYFSVEELARAYARRSETASTTSVQANIGKIAALIGILAVVILLFRRFRMKKTGATSVDLKVSSATDSDVAVTKREQEVLALISNGHSSKEIARILEISPKTVEFHRSNLLKKFNARTSSQLISLAS